MADGQVFNPRNPTFMSCLLLAMRSANEEPIQIMWNTILSTWFPPVGPQAFKLAFKSPSLASNGEPDCIVIEVRFVGGPISNSGQFQEWQIFMVECKPRSDNTPAEWDSALIQLEEYLKANNNDSLKIFGAVAMGTKVIIYEWVGQFQSTTNIIETVSMLPIHAGPLELGSPTDRVTLEAALGRVKSQGWINVTSSRP